MTYVAERPHDSALTVGDTAALIGVTVRTLHHWDEIGPATPSARTPARYRLYTDADLQRLSRAMTTLEQDLGAAIDRGVRPGSPEADELAERHREVFGNFFPNTRQMQVCLGRMSEADPGFAAHYDGIRDGLASHLAVTASQ